jgi:dephospho-CoA kinase
VPVVDADELAREAVAPGSAGLACVIEAFGAGVLAEDGRSLDRKRLGALIFEDAGARARLNAITHPMVRDLAHKRFAELDAAGVELAAYDVPLLYEVGLGDVLRPVVVVGASPLAQRTRIVERDGLSEEAAETRMAAQLPLSEKIARADYVIDNDGPVEELPPQVDALLGWLRSSRSNDPRV